MEKCFDCILKKQCEIDPEYCNKKNEINKIFGQCYKCDRYYKENEGGHNLCDDCATN